MANTPVWGQQNNLAKYHDQDLVTLTAQERNQNEEAGVIVVNDVYDGISVKTAIFAKNGSANPAARALKIEGISELDGKVIVPSQGSGHNYAMVDISNASNGDDASALKVNGKVDIDTHSDPDFASIGLHVKSTNTNQNSYAVKIAGRALIDGDGKDIALMIINDVDLLALDVEGTAQIPFFQSPSTFHDSLTLEDELIVAGPVTVGGVLRLSRSEEEGGLAAIDSIECSLHIGVEASTPRVTIGNTNKNTRLLASKINIHAPVEGDGSDLMIGTGNDTNDLVLSRADLTTHVQGFLHVDQQLNARAALAVGPGNNPGLIDAVQGAAIQDLKLGTAITTDDVQIGRATKNVESAAAKMDFEGELRVGPTGSAGMIDSGGVAGSTTDRDLYLGTQTVTQDVYLGRSGQTTNVNGGLAVSSNASVGGTLQATGNAALSGTLKVGPVGAAASIDASGSPTAQALKIGSGTMTANVELARAGQTIDMFGQARLNSNPLVMNGAANPLAANSMAVVVNALGHGNGPSFDFYINGVVARWGDAAGWF